MCRHFQASGRKEFRKRKGVGRSCYGRLTRIIANTHTQYMVRPCTDLSTRREKTDSLAPLTGLFAFHMRQF